MLRLAALVLPLALDTLAVAAALGAAGMSAPERRRAAIVLPSFEAAMPLLGLAAGGLARGVAGGLAEGAAAAALLAAGALMLLSPDEPRADAGEGRRRNSGTLLALGLSVSVDEAAAGAALGLLGVPAIAAVLLIAAQAVVASQVGFALGARLGARAGEAAERLAGVLLVALGLVVLVGALAGA